MASAVSGLARALLDLLYPPECPACGSPQVDGSALLCPVCRDLLRPLSADDPVYRETRERLAGDAALDGLCVLYPFRDGSPVRHLVHGLKYRGMSRLGVQLGTALGDHVRQSAEGRVFDCVVPVPLHRARRRERGFNQAERLAEGVARALDVPCSPGLLERVRYTDSQTRFGAVERGANVAGVFRVPPDRRAAVRGTSMLIVDDVVTTGATLGGCARVLKECGAERVLGAALALAEPKRADSGRFS